MEKQGAPGVDGKGGGPASLHGFDGSEPDNGFVKTHVLARLGHLADDKGFANEPSRTSMVSSVPSMASTATQARSLMTTVWPKSRAAT